MALPSTTNAVITTTSPSVVIVGRNRKINTITITKPTPAKIVRKPLNNVINVSTGSSNGAVKVPKFVKELPSGVIDSNNRLFLTSSAYSPGTLNVYLNGLHLVIGEDNDYTETSSTSFTMNYSPIGDNDPDILEVEYQKA